MPTSSTIASLSEELLTRIFSLVPASPRILGEVPFTVSHVSKRWHTLTNLSPLLWTTILITFSANLDALQEVLRRSQGCELDICFISSATSGRSRGQRQSLRLREAIHLLLKDSERWGSLDLTLQSNFLDSILPLISHVPFPQLHSLQLVQNDIKPTVLHCGPLVLNPKVFSTLKLRGVTVHCRHPSNLAGVTSVDFSATASCIINQEVLDTLGGVISPVHPPSMLKLASLSIIAENPSVPPHPTFRMSTLISLKIGCLSGTSPALIPPLVLLFNTLSSPFLRHLELDNILDSAWDGFLQSLQSTIIPKYPGLQTLTMRSLQLRAINPSFAAAFPAITHLNLFGVDPSPIISLISTTTWPKLMLIADGNEICLRT